MIDELRSAMNELLEGRHLTSQATATAIGAIMDGRCSEAEIAALLTALRCRGESIEELEGAARAMRNRATPIPVKTQGLLDTCGTGGDSLHTFNISTAAAIVCAAAGQPVAKHGNRSVSSSTGSADVLEALGVNLQLTPQQVAECIETVGIGFCFAPLLHGAMKYAAPVRKQLGFRTIFNLLGPLTNPARASYQIIGASRIATAEMLANALFRLGTTRAFVVCGNDQLDEVSLWGETSIFDVTPAGVGRTTWSATTLGLSECRVDELKVNSATESASVIQEIFAGRSGPARDIVIANAAAALFVSGKCLTPTDAAAVAAEAIDTEKATLLCKKLIEFSQSLKQT